MKRSCKLKLILSVFLFALTARFGPVTAAAAGITSSTIAPADIIISGDCSGSSGYASYTLYNDGSLVISGSGKMANYAIPAKPSPWYNYSSQIKSITVQSGITYIGNASLTGTAATKISLPDTVASIGSNGLANNILLTSLTLPAKLSSLGTQALAGNYSLKDINIAPGNLYFTTQDGVLFNRPMTKLILYPSGKSDSTYEIPASVNQIAEFAFFDADHLLSLNIPANVSTLGNECFEGMTSLKSVTFAAGSKVTTLPYSCFTTDINLTSVVLPDKLEVLDDYTFFQCASLTSVTLPESVTKINHAAFMKCGLTSIKIPKNVSKIGLDAFLGCGSLKTVRLLDNVADLEIDRHAFSGCYSISNFYLGSGNMHFCYEAFTGATMSSTGLLLTNITNLYVDSIEAFCKLDFEDNTANPLAFASNFYVNGAKTRLPQIPSSVKNLNYYVFVRSNALDGVQFLGDAPTMTRKSVYSILAYYPASNQTWTQSVLDEVLFADWKGDCALTGNHPASEYKTTAATCLADGKKEKVCTKCDTVLSTTVLKATGHKFINVTVTAPGCTYDGYSSGTCSVCGSAERFDIKPALGHEEGRYEVLYQPTCTLDGRQNVYCKRCNTHLHQEAIPAPGHKFVSGECTACQTISYLPAPVDFKASLSLGGSIKCSWSAVSGAKRYRIYYFDINGGPRYLESTTKTSFTITNPVIGSATYGVVCTNTAGTKDTSYRSGQSVRLTVHEKPVFKKITNTASGIKLTWEFNNDEKYVIYRKEADGSFKRVYTRTIDTSTWPDSSLITGTELTWTDTKAVAGHTYYYRICAQDREGVRISAYSSVNGSEIVRLPQVKDLALTATSTGHKVAFSRANGASAYQIYRKIGSSGTYKLIKTITSGSTTSYTHSGLKSGNTYYYKVRAKYTTADGKVYYGAYSTVKSRRFVARPTIDSLTSPAKSKISLTWTTASKVSSYQIQYAKKSDWSDAKLKTITGQSTASGTVSTLTSGSKYYVRMRSFYVNSSGTRTYSAWTGYKTITVK